MKGGCGEDEIAQRHPAQSVLAGKREKKGLGDDQTKSTITTSHHTISKVKKEEHKGFVGRRTNSNAKCMGAKLPTKEN